VSQNVSLGGHTELMVANHMSIPTKKTLGAVDTPKSIALWLVNHVKQLGFTPKLVLDPAAGRGVLLDAALQIFPESVSIAYEIDPTAHLNLRKYWIGPNSKAEDSLRAQKWLLPESENVLIFCNPPWGATISSEENSLYRKFYLTANGFYDTYDLFLEKAVKELPNKGWGAFFLPDSILLKQHQIIRKLLLESTQIKSITRLPEGVFEGVAMGSIAIVFKKTLPRKNSRIRISRVTRKSYKLIKADYTQISKELDRNVHYVLQQNWVSDPNSNWGMEFKDAATFINELSIFKKVECNESTWDEWFHSGRGLEIGKKSDVLSVKNTKTKVGNRRLVAVGEDVNRLCVEPSKVISRNLNNFNYKSELEDTERILVRKTGIGLKAVVASGMATTQTIYHFTPYDTAPSYALHYAAGFLLSRIVIALHLAKTGETEWRSHPYITQKAIRELNIPIPKPGSKEEKLAREIAAISKLLHKKGSDCGLEEKLDSLVCQIIGGSKVLQDWAYSFLFNIKGCTYTKSLVMNLALNSRVA